MLTCASRPSLCPSPTFKPEVEAHISAMIQENSASRVAAATKNVQVYWHTITSGSAGSLSTSAIQQQIQVLNQDYANYGFSFSLAGTDTTNNANWYSGAEPDTSAETQMKNALRKGNAGSLVSSIERSISPSRGLLLSKTGRALLRFFLDFLVSQLGRPEGRWVPN